MLFFLHSRVSFHSNSSSIECYKINVNRTEFISITWSSAGIDPSTTYFKQTVSLFTVRYVRYQFFSDPQIVIQHLYRLLNHLHTFYLFQSKHNKYYDHIAIIWYLSILVNKISGHIELFLFSNYSTLLNIYFVFSIVSSSM